MYKYRKNNKLPRIDKKTEKGQAIVEMCVGLIGVMVIFLGVIFIAGLGISNVKIYLSAKNNAEYASRNDSSFSGAGAAIYTWDYGADNLPFSADDQIMAIPANEADTVFNSQVTDSIYSEGESDGSYSYMAINELPASVRNNFTGDLDSLFLATADLVQSTSSYSESFYTLTSDLIGNSREIEQLKLNFGNLIHVEIDQIDLQQMESNQVYMPNLAP
jgi:hypothetical protein